MATPATFTATFTTAGTYTWVAPAGVTSVEVQCWGGGGGGGTGEGGGGGGGEYAAEPTNTVVAGDSYTVVVGAAGTADGGTGGGTGGNSTFSGTSATTVTAHGGGGGQEGETTAGAGGTGSTNTTHHNGGAGGTTTNFGGGGGGGSGGTASAGNAGASTSTSTGGAGATAVTGGGPGGAGGTEVGNGNTPASGPGGGAGGGSGGGGTGPAGYAGQVVITWTMASPVTIAANTSGGTYQWTAPAGVTSVSSQCWGAGGGGGAGSSDGGGGGGGGEYAAELANTVVAGDSYTLVVGAAGTAGVGGGTGGTGGNSTFSGTSATTVTAHAGAGGNGNGGNGGAGGSGSANSTHFSGGTGGKQTGSSSGGGGGGGSGGTGSGGNSGSSTANSTGGAGASAVTGGGPGGTGGNGSSVGNAPASGPGGGGGGGGSSSGAAAGYDGQVTLTWSAGSPDMATIQPGPTWMGTFKPFLPRPRPPVTPSSPQNYVTLTNSFEGGSAGTTVTFGAGGNTGGASGNALDTGSIGSSATATFDNSIPAAHGSLSLKLTTPAGATVSEVAWAASLNTQAQTWFRLYLYLTAYPVTNNAILRFEVSGSNCAELFVITTGLLNFDTPGFAAGVATTNPIPLNQWVRIEGYVVPSATAGQVSLQTYYSPDSVTPTESHTSAANLALLANLNQAWFGITSGTASFTMWLDDIGVSTAGYLGPVNPYNTSDVPQAQPGPTWRRQFKSLRPPQPPSGPYFGNQPNPSDVREIQPGPVWLDQFKPGLPRPRPQVPELGRQNYGAPALAPMAMSATGKVSPRFSASMALAPKAISASGLAGNIGTGSMALAPKAMHATDIEDFNATGSLALAPLALQGTGTNFLPFPLSPLNMLVELLVNGVWTDISGYVYQRNNIVITRGRPNETTAGTQAPSSMTLTLNNRDGRFSDKYPLGAYYGFIGLNTQIRLSAQDAVLGDTLAYRFWGVVSEWPPSWDPTGSDIYVQVVANGELRRLTQAASLRSALYRYYSSLSPAPLAYWAAEDGANAQSLASGVQGGFPMTWTGSPSLASDSSFPASAPVPSVNSAVFTGATGVAGALPVANFAVLNSGSGNWTAPPGITSAQVQCVGGGGGGGDYNGTQGGGGGGGGEYASDGVLLTPGSSYAYTVGSGGGSEGNGGTTEFTGNSSKHVIAHGGTGGDGSGNGGAGGTGSTNATAYAGGAGADGSGGPGGSGSETYNSFETDTPGTNNWTADSNISGSVQVYIWGGGGGGAGGRGSFGGGGGAGGNFNVASIGVTGGNSYSAIVASGGAGGSGDGGTGGDSAFLGDSARVDAHGGNGGNHSAGTGGAPSSASEYTKGGHGANGTSSSPFYGGGGGGGAGYGGNGGNASSYHAGAGGNSGGLDIGGGIGGTNDRAGTGPGGGGGGGDGGGTPVDGDAGASGRIELFWYDVTAAPAAAVGGGGGSSGGSASVGNDGATEAGGAAVTGGGPGGGTLAGSTFNASPTSAPGGGGGGYDSLGGPASGAGGQIIITYAASGGGDAGTTANVLRFLLNVASGGDTDGAVVARMYTTGTITYCDVVYNAASGGTLTLNGYTAAGASLFTTGAVDVNADGALLLVSVELQTSGSNITYNLTALQAGDTAVVASGSGTLDGASMGDPFSVLIDPNANLASSSFGHVAVFETYTAVTDLAGPLAGYAGENAADRFTRLCTEEGITSSIVGTDTDTELMGPQTVAQLVTLLQQCEDADRGLIYEDRNSLGLVYRTRTDLYNQAAFASLNYANGDLAQPMQPTEDDQLTRNDVTLTRLNGTSAEVMKTSGTYSTQDPPDGIGEYTYSQTVVVQADGQLADIASWIMFLGTTDQLRYPAITLDLSRSQAAAWFADVVAGDIGDYVTVANPPFWLPTGSIDQLMFGAVETLNAFVFTIAVNCVPESPYEVAVTNPVGSGSRADTDGSTLGAAIGTGDTSLTVITPTPNQPWVTTSGNSAEFPFSIIMGGEVMALEGVTSATSPQTFTVERGINGIVKAHSAGEAIDVFDPGVVAL